MSLTMFDEKMPTEVTEEIERFCEEVVPGQQPVYVPVKPKDRAAVDKCHMNVEQHVKDHGGTPLYGWIIWESPALLDAVFHCNWLTPEGELVDITPKADGETKILFLPDQTGRWNGRCIPSRRKARRNCDQLDRFVTLMGQIDNIKAKYLSGQPFTAFDQYRTVNLMNDSSMLALAICGSSTINEKQRSVVATDIRAKRKAERQRRKKQRRK